MARSRSRTDKAAAQAEAEAGGVHRPKAMIAGAIAAVCLSFALPKLAKVFSSSDAENMVYTDASLMKLAPPVPDDGSTPAPPPTDPSLEPFPTGPEVHVTETVQEEIVPEASKVVIETSADGDIALSMKLRWPQFEAGDRILAKLKFTNHSLKTCYLPGAGEPNQGLAIVIEDAEGNEVRRIVEMARNDQLPRRMEKLESATEVEFQTTVVAEDETPLAPGTYTAFAEMKPDPRLARLGLALWTAPKGTVRSKQVSLVVKAKAAK